MRFLLATLGIKAVSDNPSLPDRRGLPEVQTGLGRVMPAERYCGPLHMARMPSDLTGPYCITGDGEIVKSPGRW